MCGRRNRVFAWVGISALHIAHICAPVNVVVQLCMMFIITDQRHNGLCLSPFFFCDCSRWPGGYLVWSAKRHYENSGVGRMVGRMNLLAAGNGILSLPEMMPEL